MPRPLVGIVLGSLADHVGATPAADLFEAWDLPYEISIEAASVDPGRAARRAAEAEGRGLHILLAATAEDGLLPGTLAARSTVPVVALPLLTEGAPPVVFTRATGGVPFALAAPGDAVGAALFALQIVARAEPKYRELLREARAELIEHLREAQTRLEAERPLAQWNVEPVRPASANPAVPAPGHHAGGVRILPPPEPRTPRTPPAPHLQRAAANILAEITGRAADAERGEAPPRPKVEPLLTHLVERPSGGDRPERAAPALHERPAPLAERPAPLAERPERLAPLAERPAPDRADRAERADAPARVASPPSAPPPRPSRESAPPVAPGPDYVGRIRITSDILPVDLVEQTVDCLLGGGIVALPTDTVYGLAVDATNPAAVERLYRLKRRPGDKSIAIFIDSPRQLGQVVENIRPEVRRLLEAFWPGSLTVVFEKRRGIFDHLSAAPTIGVRIPDHAVPLTLAQEARRPLACTSANPSGEAEARSADDIEAYFGRGVDLILDAGRLPQSSPSTVVDVSRAPFRIVREGAVSGSQLAAVVGDMLEAD